MRTRIRCAAVPAAAMLLSVVAGACSRPGTPAPGPAPAPSSTVPPASPVPSQPSDPAGHREGFWELTGDTAAHDPSIIRWGSTWYVFTTGAGISVTTSTDGLAWGNRHQVFPGPPAWWATVPGHTDVADAWAPDVKAYDGQVHLFYALSSFGSRHSAIGHATAPTPAGPWTDRGPIVRTTDADSYNAIDPELIIDTAGDPWLAFGSFWDGIMLTRLGPDLRSAGDLIPLASRSTGIEAASVVHRGGYYYLFASIDSCCQGVNSTYKIVYGRSASVTGPYVDRSGRRLLDGGGTVLDAGNERWRGPGGQDVNEGNVLVRHAYDATAGGAPKLLINGLRWDAAGWPTY